MSGEIYGAAAAVLGLLFIGLANWMQRSQAQTTGARLQAGADAQAAAAVETAIAQAEADAPHTVAGVKAALKDKDF